MATSETALRLCSYAGCKKKVPSNHFLCNEHYEDYISKLIDQCPKCGRFKINDYKYCADCHFGRPAKKISTAKQTQINKNNVGIEHSTTWEKADKEATQFFVYILKLDTGKFYIGHSREPRIRLQEHLDGQTQSIKGLNPKLKYFEILPTRHSAECREADLKVIYDRNPRQIRRMLINFQDLIAELEYDFNNKIEPNLGKVPPVLKKEILENPHNTNLFEQTITLKGQNVELNGMGVPTNLDTIPNGTILTGRYKGKTTTKQKVKNILNKKIW